MCTIATLKNQWKFFIAGIIGITAWLGFLYYDFNVFVYNKDQNYLKSPSNVFPPSQWMNLEKILLPGDLLECPRALPYSHWGVYVTDGNVIQLTANRSILKESLELFMKKGKCRKNNLETEASERGLEPLPIEKIVHLAVEYYEEFRKKGSKNFEYKLLESNCQHFVTLVRFGSSFSDMADNAKENTKKINKAARIADKLVFT